MAYAGRIPEPPSHIGTLPDVTAWLVLVRCSKGQSSLKADDGPMYTCDPPFGNGGGVVALQVHAEIHVVDAGQAGLLCISGIWTLCPAAEALQQLM